MKTIVAAMITCLVLFGASLGASKFLLEPSTESTMEPQSNVGSGTKKDFTNSNKSGKTKAASMPVALRPDNAVSVEAVLQMSDSIRKMEQQLIEREQRVQKDEQRVNLLLEDLSTEQEELTALSQGIDAKVKALNESTAYFQEMLNELDTRKAELAQMEKLAGTDDDSVHEKFDTKVNDVKGWFAGLQAEQAADYLKEFANNGKLEFAASLLQKMPDRQKSKILGALSDPVLVDQLIDALSVRSRKK